MTLTDLADVVDNACGHVTETLGRGGVALFDEEGLGGLLQHRDAALQHLGAASQALAPWPLNTHQRIAPTEA